MKHYQERKNKSSKHAKAISLSPMDHKRVGKDEALFMPNTSAEEQPIKPINPAQSLQDNIQIQEAPFDETTPKEQYDFKHK